MSGAEQPGRSTATRTQFTAPVFLSTDGLAELRPDETANGYADTAEHLPAAGLPSSVIHELRTPLTSIHGYAQVLQRSLRNEPKTANALAVVVRESTRLSAMLAELSELADLQTGELVAMPIEHEVHQIVDGVVHEVTRRDTVGHPIAIQGSATAHCNPTLLSQVLLHVLTNAIRYSEAGSPIEISIETRGTTVEIAVSDRGIGVEPGDDRRIYGLFERGSNARQAGIRGIGLGLYLAARQLESMGGRLLHERRQERGTVFRITVPAA